MVSHSCLMINSLKVSCKLLLSFSIEEIYAGNSENPTESEVEIEQDQQNQPQNWYQNDFNASIQEFVGEVRFPNGDTKTLLHYFRKYFTGSLLNLICNQTNA